MREAGSLSFALLVAACGRPPAAGEDTIGAESGAGTQSSAAEVSDGASAGDGDEGTCDEPLLDCDGVCIDPGTNGQHCGECGAWCWFDEACESGVCVRTRGWSEPVDVVSASIGITVADTNSSGDFAAAFQGGELGLSVMAFRYDFLLDQWSDSVEVDEHSLGVDVGDIEMLESGDIVVSYAKGTAPTVAATSAWNSVTGTWQEPHEVPATFEIGAQLGPDLAESSDGGLMMIWEDWAGGLESVFSLTAGVDVPWAEATVADFYASKHTRQVFGLAGGGYGVLEQDYAPGEPRDLRLWRWTESGGWVLAGTILEQVLGGMSRNRVGAGAIVWTSGDPDALTHVTLVDLATGELGVEVALASGERVTRSHLTDQGDVLLVVERDRGSVTEFSARHFDGNTGAWGESYDFASESPETVAVWFGFGSDHAGNAHLVWTRGVGTNPELIWSVFDAEHQVWREGEVIRTADEALHWGLLHASSGGAVFLTETRQEPQAAPFHRVEVWR